MSKFLFLNILLFSSFVPFEVLASKNQKVTITLKNDDVLHGTIIEGKSSESVKVFEHPQLGELTINKKEIKSIVNNAIKIKVNQNKSEIISSKNPTWSGSLSVGLDTNVTNRYYSKTLDIDLSGQISKTMGSYSNDFSFDWNNDQNLNKGSQYYDNQTLELDLTRQMQVKDWNLSLHTSNKYDYNSYSSYGKYSNIFTAGLTKHFQITKDSKFLLTLGPSLHSLWGGDYCDASQDCGETYYSRSIFANLSTQLSKRFELDIENEYTTTYASKPLYGNVFTSTLTFRPSDNSNFNSSLKYSNSYKEYNDPTGINDYSINIGYDF